MKRNGPGSKPNVDFSGPRAVEFAEKDLLPGAENKAAVFNDDRNRTSHQ
jgi:hypothetical protein